MGIAVGLAAGRDAVKVTISKRIPEGKALVETSADAPEENPS
jgi:hypothetical protein